VIPATTHHNALTTRLKKTEKELLKCNIAQNYITLMKQKWKLWVKLWAGKINYTLHAWHSLTTTL